MKLVIGCKVSLTFESALKTANAILHNKSGFLGVFNKLNYSYNDPEYLFQIASQRGVVPIMVNSSSESAN